MPSIIIQKSEDNIVLEPGDYPARITKAAAGLQQSGKHNGAEKIEVWWRVAEQNTVRDNLLWVPSMNWKISKFAEATGYGRPGDNITIDAENVIGRSCIVSVIKEEVTTKSGSNMWVNRISGYKVGVGKVDDFLADEEP